MNCTHCTAPTADGITLCHADSTQLEEVLDQIPDALATARDTVARLDRLGVGGTTGKNASPPEAVNVNALDHTMHLEGLVMSWSRLLLEEDNPDMSSVTPIAYLSMSVSLIRTKDWAGDMLDEMDEALRDVQRDVDRPQERFAYGACGGKNEDGDECAATITAVPDVEWAVCRVCGSAHDLNARISDMRAKARGEPMTAVEVRKWLFDKAGIKVKGQDFKNWVFHGILGYVLERVTVDDKPTRIYYPGDVFKVHHHMQARRRNAA